MQSVYEFVGQIQLFCICMDLIYGQIQLEFCQIHSFGIYMDFDQIHLICVLVDLTDLTASYHHIGFVYLCVDLSICICRALWWSIV